MERGSKPGSGAEVLLIAQAKGGSQEAFAALSERYGGMIRRQAAYLHGPLLDREDLEQEGLLGLLYAVRSYKPGESASFYTYARVCVRHRMISAARRVKLLVTLNVPYEPRQDGGGNDPEQRLLDREEEERLHRRLKKHLTSLEYEALKRHLDGYSYEETARLLGVGAKAVDNALQRVRRKLS